MFIDNFFANLSIPIIVVLVIFSISFLTYFIVKIYRIVLYRKFKPLSKILNAEIKSTFFGGTFLQILNYGPEIRLKLTLGGKDSPPVLYLQLFTSVGFNFRIMKKQLLINIFFRSGKEASFGDTRLDQEFSIRSDKPEEASSYLLYSKRIDAIKYFLENNFTEIKADAKGVYVSKINYSEQDLTPEKIGAYLDNLNSFTRV
jgi:hypothetical protein